MRQFHLCVAALLSLATGVPVASAGPPARPPAEVRKQIESDLKELDKRIAALGVEKAATPDLLADATVFRKGAVLARALRGEAATHGHRLIAQGNRTRPRSSEMRSPRERTHGRSKRANSFAATSPPSMAPCSLSASLFLGLMIQPNRSDSTSCCTAAANPWD